MIDMLVKRYTKVSRDRYRASQPHRYAIADHVPCRTVGAARIADFIALDCQRPYGPAPHPVHGFEIKASRADWLMELRHPEKAEAFKPYMSHWWLVVSDARIVRDGELPDDWGLLAAAQGARLREIKPAPKLPAEPMPWPMTVAFTRAVAVTARRVGAS